jgi:hypothetical protein
MYVYMYVCMYVCILLNEKTINIICMYTHMRTWAYTILMHIF